MRCRILLSKSELWVIKNVDVIVIVIVYNRLSIRFSNVFAIFENREIERQLLQSNFESFLKTGTTFAILSTEGKTLVMKERLNNLPIASKFNFLEEIMFYKVYYLSQKPY